MSKRIFVAVSLLATVCAAHADVLPASPTSQANFLDHWTDAKGNDVASSNVLGSNVRLVGGVALGNETAAQALLKKASAAAANGGAVTVKRAEGITGTYALAKSNYKAAAAAGNAVSVRSTSDGDMLVSQGLSGGGSQDAAGGAGGGAAGGAGAGGSFSGGVAGGVFVPADANLGNLGSLPAASGNGAVNGAGAGTGVGAAADPASPSGEVPEPSTIALMFAGMAGVMSMARRRAR